ncbi:MAG: hypothetical protein RHS_4993 [Robinsoniella sp. RHS]|nr:MAG: hypothetical protein RHS_4993 [Robinsoniella sp. RHS]
MEAHSEYRKRSQEVRCTGRQEAGEQMYSKPCGHEFGGAEMNQIN